MRVQNALHLSDAEIMEVTHFERGNGLISTNNNNIMVEFKASPLEKDLITTDRRELKDIVERMRQQKKPDNRQDYAPYTHGLRNQVSYASVIRTDYAFTERKVAPVKTRADLYGGEATELLRIISMYPGLTEKQLCRFYPGREDVTRNLLSHLARQGRTRQADTGGYFPYGNQKAEADPGMVRAAWVLLDFIDKAEYHSSSDFPVKIVFSPAANCMRSSMRLPGRRPLSPMPCTRTVTAEAAASYWWTTPGRSPFWSFRG